MHGFVSQGFIKSTDNNYLAASERGSFEFTEAGINFTKVLDDRLSVGMQLFVRDLGSFGNYRPTFDWFYLDYHLEDWLGFRAGRTKLPFGLYNESSDIDAAHVPILLPQSIYPAENRDFLLAQTGVELYGTLPFAERAFDYRLYGGTIFMETTSLGEADDIDVPYLAGARLSWRTPLNGLLLAASAQTLRIELDHALTAEEHAAYQQVGWLPPNHMGPLQFDFTAKLWVASIEYQVDELWLAAEYGRWHIEAETNLQVPPSDLSADDDRMYVMGSYRVRPWFTPGMYYSLWLPHDEDGQGPDAYQHDVAVTFRFDLTDYWLLKFENHFMHGTAALNSDLNDGKPRDQLKENWLVFLVKTTAYF